MNENDSTFFAQEWLTTTGLDWGTRILLALLIFVIGRIVARLLTGLMMRALQRAKIEATLSGFLGRIANIILLLVVVMAALEKLGVQTTSLVAMLGAAGLAVGLALQGSLSNFAAGVMIIVLRPFKVGDFIQAGGTSGIVEGINIFSTSLRTPQNQAVIVPNGQIGSATITNFSGRETRRIDLTLGVSYNDDLRVAKETIWRVIKADERILTEPAPIVGVTELGASSVDFAIWFWVKSPDFLATRMDTIERLKLAIEAAGCSIPYPQSDVHLHPVEKPAPPAETGK